MQQLTFAGAGRLEWEDVPAPELTSGDDALVRPVAVATCDLDTAVDLGAGTAARARSRSVTSSSPTCSRSATRSRASGPAIA